MKTVSVGTVYSNGKSKRKVIDIQLNIELPAKGRQRTVVYVKDGESFVRSCKESSFLSWISKGDEVK